jgi:hypothetical protein
MGIEDIVGKVGKRTIPLGLADGEGDTVRFVELIEGGDPVRLYQGVASQVEPVIPKEGAVKFAGDFLKLPDGRCFIGLKYRGDIAGWINQIELGADRLGYVTARVKDGVVYISDGSQVGSDACEFFRDNA